jgi:hypothetical protein
VSIFFRTFLLATTMADPNNDSFASEAGGKDLNAKLVPAPVAREFMQLIVTNVDYRNGPIKIDVLHHVDEIVLRLAVEDKQLTMRNAQGEVIYYIKKVHKRFAHKVWYIHDSQGTVRFTARSRMKGIAWNEMVTFYKGMVNFSRLTGNPEGKEEPIYAVSRPAPTTLNNLLMRGGKNCKELVADCDENLGKSKNDLAVRIQPGHDYAFVVFGLVLADASKEDRFNPFDQVPASPGMRPAFVPQFPSSVVPQLTPPPIPLSSGRRHSLGAPH